MSVLSIIASSICYADTYDVPVNIGCYPSGEVAIWQRIGLAEPHTQYTITPLGIDVAGESEIVTSWDTRTANGKRRRGVAVVYVRCVPPFGEPFALFSTARNFVLTPYACPKGAEMDIRFPSPNSPNPTDYVSRNILTVTRDEDSGAPSVAIPLKNTMYNINMLQMHQAPAVTVEHLMGNIKPTVALVGDGSSGYY